MAFKNWRWDSQTVTHYKLLLSKIFYSNICTTLLQKIPAHSFTIQFSTQSFLILTSATFRKMLYVFRMEPSSYRWHSQTSTRWKLHWFSSSPGSSILTENFLKMLYVFRMEPSSCRWHSRTSTRWKLHEFLVPQPKSFILKADTFLKMLSVFRMEPSSWEMTFTDKYPLKAP